MTTNDLTIPTWRELEPDNRSWKRQVRFLDKRLESVYHSPTHGNLKNPTDELFFILLTKKTPPSRYFQVYRDLRRSYRPWDKLVLASAVCVSRMLRPLGMENVRGMQLVRIAEQLQRQFGRVTLSPLKRMSLGEAKNFLLSLPGVGEKSARCVLMYSLGHDTSPMDAHATRVAARLGLLPEDCSAAVAHRIFDERLPRGMARRLHVNMVAHGRDICRPQRQKCEKCVVLCRCPAGNLITSLKQRTAASVGSERRRQSQ